MFLLLILMFVLGAFCGIVAAFLTWKSNRLIALVVLLAGLLPSSGLIIYMITGKDLFPLNLCLLPPLLFFISGIYCYRNVSSERNQVSLMLCILGLIISLMTAAIFFRAAVGV